MIDRLHPLTILVYFLFAALTPAFSGNPLFHALAFFTGFIMLFTWKEYSGILKQLPFYLLFFLVVSLFNPFFYHNGNTVLFYMAGRRITLEALLFGADSALMVTGVLIWFESLSHYMTSDKVLLLFGKISTKAATIISLVLRIIPHYREYIRKYRKHQKLLGLYGDGSFLERLRGEGKLFVGFITWALEHSMTSADSMTARGYGVVRRKSYSYYKIRTRDVLFLLLALAATAFLSFSISRNVFATVYYPNIVLSEPGVLKISGFMVYIISSSVMQIYCFAALKKFVIPGNGSGKIQHIREI